MAFSFSPVKRSAIIIGAKEPFINWIFNIRQAHYGPAQVSRQDIEKRTAEKRNVYLIPPSGGRAPDELVREASLEIFENELRDWCLKSELWPEDRSWDVFREWFYYEFLPVVLDAAQDASL